MTNNNQEFGRDRAASATGDVDLDFLAQQTFHDLNLQREILELFVTQARTLVPTLPTLEPEEQGFVAHRLVGSARAIGAWAAADAARAFERATGDARAACVPTLLAAFESVVATIEAHLRDDARA